MDKVVSKTKYDRKEHKKFYMFHLFHRSGTLYFMIVLLVLLGIMTVTDLMDKEKNGTFTMIMFGLTLGIIPFMIISRINEVVRQETPERIKSSDMIEVTKHKLIRVNDTIKGKGVIGWNNLDCVCETDEFFYLYTTDKSGLFIKKADIVEGSVELFRKLALANMPVDKKGKVKYKRYGNVKKVYKAEQKEIKRQKKLAKGSK